MLMSEKEFNEKYAQIFQESLATAKDYLDNPEKLRNEVLLNRKSYYQNGLRNPEPDQFAYRLMRYRAFVNSPIRLKNYILSENEAFSVKPNYLPYIMDIEPNSRCNFRCIMCQVSEWNKGQRARDMSFEELKSFVDRSPQIIEAKLQGMGEPLMHKDFINMIEYLSEKNIWVRTTINGSLLHIRNHVERIIDSGVGEIQTSFDGATKEVFESIRKKSNFDRVVNNLTQLNQYANRKKRLYTRMWVVLQKENRHQLFEFVELAKKMEFRRLTFSLSLGDWGQDDWKEKTSKLQEIPLTAEEEDRLLKIAQESNLDISTWAVAEKYSSDKKENLCPWPFKRAFVSSDMKIVPCCMIGNPEITELGSAYDFDKAWESESYQNFRQDHINGLIPKYCTNCYK